MNTVLHCSGIYSCAIDAFLEIWLRVVNPVLDGDLNCEFISILKEAGRGLEEAVALNLPNKLILARMPVWNYVKDKCSSFRRMNCEAQFSQIFTLSTFELEGNCNSIANPSLKEFLISEFKSSGFCNECQDIVEVTSDVFLNYMTPQDFSSANNLNEFWSNAIVSNSQPQILQCSNCLGFCRTIRSVSRLSKVLFVELAPNLMNAIKFEKRIILSGKVFLLAALGRNSGAHFSCAVLDNNQNRWKYIDDLKYNITFFNSVEDIYHVNSIGWFFGVYIDETLLSCSALVDQFRVMPNDTNNIENSLPKVTAHNNAPSVANAEPISKKIKLGKTKDKVKVNELRRKKYHENKGKINKQRRKNYADKKTQRIE